jgi:hypothetical protein
MFDLLNKKEQRELTPYYNEIGRAEAIEAFMNTLDENIFGILRDGTEVALTVDNYDHPFIHYAERV